jgi:hypothetical protein
VEIFESGWSFTVIRLVEGRIERVGGGEGWISYIFNVYEGNGGVWDGGRWRWN